MSETIQTADAPEADIAALIEHDIRIGALAPGAWLKQVELERRYGCSRAAVRHALAQLAARRVVRYERYCGYNVPSFDGRMLREMSEVRALLEVAAVELVLPAFQPEQARELRRLASLFKLESQTGTLADQHRANIAFHRALLRPCPNTELVELIIELRERVPLAVQERKNTPARMAATARDHFVMVDALLAGDLPTLRRVTREHILEPEVVPGRHPAA